MCYKHTFLHVAGDLPRGPLCRADAVISADDAGNVNMKGQSCFCDGVDMLATNRVQEAMLADLQSKATTITAAVCDYLLSFLICQADEVERLATELEANADTAERLAISNAAALQELNVIVDRIALSQPEVQELVSVVLSSLSVCPRPTCVSH